MESMERQMPQSESHRPSIAVLLLDRDGRRVRDRMTGLARSGHVEVAESAESADAWLPRADSVQPDVILISADTFSEQEIEEATAMLEPVHPESRVILVDVPAGDRGAPRPASLSAWARVRQGAPFAKLDETICRVAGGQAIVSGERLGRLMLHLQQQVQLGPSVPAGTTGLARARLTAREREVLGLMADRLTNREIAAALNLELGTVKNHVHSVLKKLSLQNRQQAVYFRSGAFPLPSASHVQVNL
jgi:DNA-binding NarL/FixJ family response regulator